MNLLVRRKGDTTPTTNQPILTFTNRVANLSLVMKSTAHRIFTATTGISLIAFAIISAFTAGVVAPPSIIAFGLLAVFGLLEITIASYSSRWIAPSGRRDAESSIAAFPARESYERAA
jgi:hypothetical protein